MSVFSKIMDKIFHRGGGATAAAPEAPQAASQAVASAPQPAPEPVVAAAPAPSEPVDVEAVLTQMAELQGGGGNWRTSIVDLLKMLNLDSSLDARKELADELSVRAGPDGSAEQNIALHKAVMQALADNGGLVPDSLKS